MDIRERGGKRRKHRERVSKHTGIFRGIKGECYHLFGASIGRIKYNPHVQINCKPIIAAETTLGSHIFSVTKSHKHSMYLKDYDNVSLIHL